MANTTSVIPTDAQMQVLRLIAKSVAEHGYPPTIRELADTLGVSQTSVWFRLAALRRKGFVTSTRAGTARTLQITEAGRLLKP